MGEKIKNPHLSAFGGHPLPQAGEEDKKLLQFIEYIEFIYKNPPSGGFLICNKKERITAFLIVLQIIES